MLQNEINKLNNIDNYPIPYIKHGIHGAGPYNTSELIDSNMFPITKYYGPNNFIEGDGLITTDTPMNIIKGGGKKRKKTKKRNKKIKKVKKSKKQIKKKLKSKRIKRNIKTNYIRKSYLSVKS